jgi:solute:Na+ symporter, SSS family
VFFQFVQPPLFFNPSETASVKAGVQAQEFRRLESRQNDLFREKSDGIRDYLNARHGNDPARLTEKKERLVAIQQQYDDLHAQASRLVTANDRRADGSDTNYIFLSFVLSYLPAGLIGLIFACIFTASMSSASGELSALATTSVIDIYQRFIKKNADGKHYLLVSRLLMAFWGIYGIAFAQYASRIGSLIEAVNILGSLFYGTMLGIFLLAFYCKSVKGTAAFVGALSGGITVLCCARFTSLAWLWYNVLGCGVCVGVGLLLTRIKIVQSRS